LKIGVPKETVEHEKRVALVPDMVKKLLDSGFEVRVEAGAGAAAGSLDDDYRNAGATIAASGPELLADSDIVLKVQPPGPAEIAQMKEGAVLISFLQASRDRNIVEALTRRKITALSMHRVPRITRAQSMDALSSQSNIAGYKAVLVGAATLGKLLPMMTTAAGTIRPSSVFVLGAGVAGLQAIATARRLGAVVSAFDVRPVVKEQVESLGAKFLEVELGESDTETAGGYAKELSEESHRKEQELLQKTLSSVDIVITTALIPDRPAPKLISEDMVRGMRPGSVIVDLAAETGGNCELTSPGETVVKHGVSIVGHLNLPSTVAVHSSQMYSRNVVTLVAEMLDKEAPGTVRVDLENDVIGPTTITHAGEIRTWSHNA
jgi:NAD(P) transhydrogenase subunit alpha